MAKIAPSELIINGDRSIYHLHLFPENITDDIVFVGDPDRVAKVSKYFDTIEFKASHREFVTHIGSIGNKKLIVMSTGMGVSNIEIALTELDALVNFDFDQRQEKIQKRSLNIMRLGTSGAIQPDIPVGSHLLSREAIGFDNILDFYQLPQNTEEVGICSKLQKSLGLSFLPYFVSASNSLIAKLEHDTILGTTATMPGFYAPQGRKLRLPLKYAKFVDVLAQFDHANGRITNFEMETSGIYAFGRMLGHNVLSISTILANRPLEQFSSDPEKEIDKLIVKILGKI